VISGPYREDTFTFRPEIEQKDMIQACRYPSTQIEAPARPNCLFAQLFCAESYPIGGKSPPRSCRLRRRCIDEPLGFVFPPAQGASPVFDMWPTFLKGVTEHLPNSQITFDKSDVIAHASTAVEATRRIELKVYPRIKGLRCY